jgi:ATP-dependent Clp protease adaptor protein ClpS
MSVQVDTIEHQKTSLKIQKPKKFKVIFFNDDYTPFEFVEAILQEIYKKNESEAQALAYKVHQHGKAIIAIYPKEIAETKLNITMKVAQQQGHPLHCELEESEDE